MILNSTNLVGDGRDGPDEMGRTQGLEQLKHRSLHSRGLPIVNVEREYSIDMNVDNIIIPETNSSRRIDKHVEPAGLSKVRSSSIFLVVAHQKRNSNMHMF